MIPETAPRDRSARERLEAMAFGRAFLLGGALSAAFWVMVAAGLAAANALGHS